MYSYIDKDAHTRTKWKCTQRRMTAIVSVSLRMYYGLQYNEIFTWDFFALFLTVRNIQKLQFKEFSFVRIAKHPVELLSENSGIWYALVTEKKTSASSWRWEKRGANAFNGAEEQKNSHKGKKWCRLFEKSILKNEYHFYKILNDYRAKKRY